MSVSRKTFVAALTAALLLSAAVGTYQLRRHFIAQFFDRADEHLQPASVVDIAKGADLPTVERVRVILIDGLDRATAHTLPSLSATCKTGIDSEVDVGFPTVSLPVQSVLWTGLTQQQTGVLFVGGERLTPPPTGSIPARVDGAVAVAELHPYLVHSFGFSTAEPSGDKLDDDHKAEWTPKFLARAAAAVASPSRLVFVHIGRVDVAGHKYGGASVQYREAAAAADSMLASLIDKDPPSDRVRWFILADHGHLPGGGHGGTEESLRVVRGCIVGNTASVESAVGGRVNLIDIARAIAASLGLGLHESSRARPLSVALTETTAPLLPTVSLSRSIGAAVIILLACFATFMFSPSPRTWPWWILIAYVAVLVFEGLPTLSTPMIYPPRGRDMYLAASPGLLVLAASLAVTLRRSGLRTALLGSLLVPAALALACLVAAGGATAPLDSARPPLIPHWTAHASLFLTVNAAAFAVAALAVLAIAGQRAFGRDGPPGTTHRST